jgi:hypothetical protein
MGQSAQKKTCLRISELKIIQNSALNSNKTKFPSFPALQSPALRNCKSKLTIDHEGEIRNEEFEHLEIRLKINI